MAIGIIAQLTIQSGKNKEFESIFAELEAAVVANETGCNFYSCHKTDDPNVYVVLEQYKDQESLDAHGKTDHFRTIGAKLGGVMGGRPDIKRMTSIS